MLLIYFIIGMIEQIQANKLHLCFKTQVLLIVVQDIILRFG